MGTTTKLSDWDSEENYVEQAMESAMYNSAHSDDTLVLVGPARKPDNPSASLKAVGILQNFSIQQGKQVIPHSAIGSARTFFQSSKVQVSGSIGRLFVNGKNLYRVLYDNAFSSGSYDLTAKPLPHAEKNESFLANLDSSLFLIPFGMAVVYRDKAKNTIGGIYIEMMVIPTWSSTINAGSPTIVEGTSFMADRVRALSLTGMSAKDNSTETYKMNDITALGNSDLERRLDDILKTK